MPLDPEGGAPLYRQLYDGLRDAILSGRLGPGARLPSSRALAADLDVARNTVLQAFAQLRSEGYLAGRRGGGTRVRATLPDRLLSVPRERRRRGGGPGGASAEGAAHTPELSKRGALLVDSGRGYLASGAATPVRFQLGVPAVDAFPIRLWGRLAGRRWRRRAVALADGDPAGVPELRAAIASYLEASRGARCTADQVLVLNGAQQALHLVAQVLLDPGDRAWIEDPGYTGARAALEAAGARLVPVPVDGAGLDVEAGERAAPEARLAYVTPSHQFPLGVVMSAPRRLGLLAWARRAGAWVVEDDYDSEYRYAGRPLPSLQGLDAEAVPAGGALRVLYVGTFSKTLVPGLRLGYLVVPDALVDAFRAARAAVDVHTATPSQEVLADFIGEGHYGRHIRHVRALCAERQAALLAAVSDHLPDLLELAPDPAGLHLVGRLPRGVADTEAASRAEAEGVSVSPLSRFALRDDPARRGALLLGYAGYAEREIRDGARALRRALLPLCGGSTIA